MKEESYEAKDLEFGGRTIASQSKRSDASDAEMRISKSPPINAQPKQTLRTHFIICAARKLGGRVRFRRSGDRLLHHNSSSLKATTTVAAAAALEEDDSSSLRRLSTASF